MPGGRFVHLRPHTLSGGFPQATSLCPGAVPYLTTPSSRSEGPRATLPYPPGRAPSRQGRARGEGSSLRLRKLELGLLPWSQSPRGRGPCTSTLWTPQPFVPISVGAKRAWLCPHSGLQAPCGPVLPWSALCPQAWVEQDVINVP